MTYNCFIVNTGFCMLKGPIRPVRPIFSNENPRTLSDSRCIFGFGVFLP